MAFLYHKIVYQETEKVTTYELPDTNDQDLSDLIAEINSGKIPDRVISIEEQFKVLDEDTYFEADDLRSSPFSKSVRIRHNEQDFIQQG